MEEAAYVIDGRPPGGSGSIVTKDYLDLRLAAVEARLDGRIAGVRTEMVTLGGDLRTEMAGLRTEMATLGGNLQTEMERQTKAQLRWLVPTVFAGLTAVGTIVAVFD